MGMRKDEFKLPGYSISLCLNTVKTTILGCPSPSFTAPKPEQIATMINNDPTISDPAKYLEHPYADIKANAYDMVRMEMKLAEVPSGSSA
jgi:hypothetical protein